MFLNAFTDRSRPRPQKGRRKQQITFDFVVAERPIYIPGSGPPLAPVTVMPIHDKDGIIEGEMKIGQQLMFIVSYTDHPYLRVSVKPQNILDWVSPRTYEAWESAKTEAEIQAERDELLPKIEAREKKKLLKQQGGASASRAVEGPKKTWSRKRKRPPTPEPAPRPGRKRRGVETEEEEAVIPSPRRPSMTSPTKQRGLAQPVDQDSEEDDEDEDSMVETTSELLDRQLNGTPRRSKLANEILRSPTTSPEPQPKKSQHAKKPSVPPFDRRETRSGSTSSAPDRRGREARSSSNSRPPSRQDAVAATSSRQANAIYEKLQQKSQVKGKTISEKYSYLGKPPTSSQRQAAANPTRHKSETPKRKKGTTPEPVEEEEEDEEDEEDDDEDDEPEYEVDAILADEYRMDKKQKPVLYYLIKWVGDWDDTWEPAENVGRDAINEYEVKKAAEQRGFFPSTATLNTTKAKSGYDEEMNEMSDDVVGIDPKGKGKQKMLFGSGSQQDLKGKGKAKSPYGAGGFDGMDEESEEDSLFVKDRSPVKGILKETPAQKRGEVIDDESASDDF